MVEVQLQYQRVANSTVSDGRIISKDNGLETEEAQFSSLQFKYMIARLSDVLHLFEGEFEDGKAPAVTFQRTDRTGFLPIKLDRETVRLIFSDPVAAATSMDYPQNSPSNVQRRVNAVPEVPALTRIGTDVRSDAFGDVLFFKVRGHELECPGCGFWGMYTSPGLLADPDRAGQEFKTSFVCPKKCSTRFVVSCLEKWGYVYTDYLLEHTKLDAFYFPRPWNKGRSWVTREDLQKLYNQYKQDKENVHGHE